MLVLFVYSATLAQNTFKATIQEAETNEPLYGVSVFIEELNKGAVTDMDGAVQLQNIPNGQFKIEIRYVGFQTLEITRTFPLGNNQLNEIFQLEESHEEME